MDTKLKLITTLFQGLPQIAIFKSQFSYNIDISELLLVAGEKKLKSCRLAQPASLIAIGHCFASRRR